MKLPEHIEVDPEMMEVAVPEQVEQYIVVTAAFPFSHGGVDYPAGSVVSIPESQLSEYLKRGFRDQ